MSAEQSHNEQTHNERNYHLSRLKNVCKLVSAGAAVCVSVSKFRNAELMSAVAKNDYKLTSEWVYNDNLRAKSKQKPRAPEMRSNIAKVTSLEYSFIRGKGSKHISEPAKRGKHTNAARMRLVKSTQRKPLVYSRGAGRKCPVSDRKRRRRRPASNRKRRRRRTASTYKVRRRRLASNRGARGKRLKPSNARARSSTLKQPKGTLNFNENLAFLLALPEAKSSKKIGDGHADNITTPRQTDTIAMEIEAATPSSIILPASKTDDSAAIVTGSMAAISKKTWDNGMPLSESTLLEGQLTAMAQDEATRTIFPGRNLLTTQYDSLNEASDMLQNDGRRRLLAGSFLGSALTLVYSSIGGPANESSAPVTGEQNGRLSESQPSDVILQEARRNLHHGIMNYGSEKERNEERVRAKRFIWPRKHTAWRDHRFPCFDAKLHTCPILGVAWTACPNNEIFFSPSSVTCPDPENLVGEVWAGFPEARARPYPTGESLSNEFPTAWDHDPPIFEKDPFLTGAFYNARTDKKRTSPEEDSVVFFDLGVAKAKDGIPTYDDCKTSVRGINRIGLEAKAILWMSEPGVPSETPRILLQVKHQHGRTVDQLEQLSDRDILMAAVALCNSKDIKDVTDEPRTRTVAKKYAKDFVDKLLNSGVFIRTITPDMVTFDPKSTHPFSVIPKKDVTCASLMDACVINADAAAKSGFPMKQQLTGIIESFLNATMAHAKETAETITAGNSTFVTAALKSVERFRQAWPVRLRKDIPLYKGG